MQLVFFSEIKWTYMRTRKQFLVRHLPPSWQVIFLEPFAFGRRNSFRPIKEGRVTYVTVPFLRGGTTSRLYNALVGTAAFRWLLSKLCLLWVRGLFAALKVPARRTFVVSNPYSAGTALSLGRDLLCYDYNDNPFQFPQTPGWVRTGLDALLGRSDLVFVVSRHYLDMLAGEGFGNLHLLGNGVEYDHFSRPRPVPPEMAELPRPVLLYTGRLGPLIDFELMGTMARAFTRGTLLLIGPVDPASRGEVSALSRAENVVWMDERPYEVLPGYIQAADVCVAPFKLEHRHTVGINPNKIYQYMAAGRPIVSSYIAELEGVAGDVRFARSAGDFVEGVREALASPPPEENLKEFARRNDWKVRARRMAELISEALKTRRTL